MLEIIGEPELEHGLEKTAPPPLPTYDLFRHKIQDGGDDHGGRP